MPTPPNAVLFAIEPEQIPDEYEERAINDLEGAISLPKVLLDVQQRDDVDDLIETENLRRLYGLIGEHRESSISDCMYDLMLESPSYRVLNLVIHFNYLLMKSNGPDDFLTALRSELEPEMSRPLNQDFLLDFIEYEMIAPRYEKTVLQAAERL